MRSAVWITHEANPDPRTGGGLRSRQLVAALAATMPVDVLSLNPLDIEAYRAATGVRDAFVALPLRRNRVRTKVSAWSRGWPAVFGASLSPAGSAYVAARVADGDLVVLEHLRTLAYRPPGHPCVVALQNVDSDLIGSVEGRPASWLHVTAHIDRCLARRAEKRLLRDPRALVTVVSELDAGRIGGSPVVVPNGVDLPVLVPPRPKTGTVTFVGSMTYAPNREAVRWWAEEVWPVRPDDMPRLTVIGRGSEVLRQRFGSHPALDLLGEVPDVGVALASTSVVAVPLTAGSGTRLKVLEAMAWGRPVVSTSKGAEGLGGRDGEHLLLADDPKSFGAAVMRLREDHGLADSLAHAGRELAERHDWSLIGPRFAQAVGAHAREWPMSRMSMD